MKKSLILVGLLSIGYAHAQYEGKVGVNTEIPTATLNVKSKVNNGKNLELENLSGTKLVTVLDNGNVGIGTEAPTNSLQIVNSQNIPLSIKNTQYAYSSGALQSTLSFKDKNDLAYAFIGDYTSIKRFGILVNDYQTGLTSLKKNGGSSVLASSSIMLDAGLENERIIFEVGGDGSDKYISTIDKEGRWRIGLHHLEESNEKLDVNGNARLRTLPSVAGSDTDKVVVVDRDGVLKTVERGSIGGGAEVDGVIGNEVTNATQNGGLVRAGRGTQADPYTLGLPTANVKKGQVMTWTGTAWEAQDSAVSTISEKSIVRNFREDNSSTVTVRDDDYYVYLTGNPIAINMPAATATNKGKVYCLYNAGSNNADLSPQSVGPQQTLSASQVACYISSGTSWFNLTGY